MQTSPLKTLCIVREIPNKWGGVTPVFMDACPHCEFHVTALRVGEIERQLIQHMIAVHFVSSTFEG